MSERGKESAIAMFERHSSGHTPDAAELKTHVIKEEDLGEIFYKPLEWFKINPENELFRQYKEPSYWSQLEKDMRETGYLRQPLIASAEDGLIYSGESRFVIARKLADEGLEQWKKLPVRCTTKPLSPEEQRRIIYAENILRFPVPEDVKAHLFSEMYPDFFTAEKLPEGRRDESAEAPPTAAQIARATGTSPSRVKRTRELVKKATEIAKKRGKDKPTVQEIKEARERANKERRAKEKKKIAASPPQTRSSLLTIQLTLKEADENVKALSQNLTPLRRQIIAKIRKVRKLVARH